MPPKTTQKPSIWGFTPENLFDSLSFDKAFRKKQFMQWLYHTDIDQFSAMHNLGSDNIRYLNENFSFYSLKLLKKTSSGKALTQKFLFETHEGYKIEAVLIPDSLNDRFTLCLSSQVGCSYNCRFCATGEMAMQRNLTAGEIVEQYVQLNRECGKKIKNIVFMGMGEPFVNLANVFKSIHLLTHKESINMSPSRISVSTSGVLRGIKKIADELPKVHLLLSLHSCIQESRDLIMPNVTHMPLPELQKSLQYYQDKSGQEVTLEYILIDGINDDDNHVEALIQFSKKLRCKINLIAYNINPGQPFRPTPADRIHSIRELLNDANINAVQRFKKGDDINAACGQLAIKDMPRKTLEPLNL